jgi:hypothetical protein
VDSAEAAAGDTRAVDGHATPASTQSSSVTPAGTPAGKNGHAAEGMRLPASIAVVDADVDLRPGASPALRLATELTIRDGVEKWLLRHAFTDLLPDDAPPATRTRCRTPPGYTNASGCSGRCSRGCTAPSADTSPRPTREPRRGRPVQLIPDATPARVVPVAVDGLPTRIDPAYHRDDDRAGPGRPARRRLRSGT